MGTFKRVSAYLPPLSIALLALAFHALGDGGLQALRYHRQAIAEGEIWRLVTGHLVHLNTAHLAGNLAGLAIIWLLVAPALSANVALLMLFGAAIACDLGLWIFNPELLWYVGLSGALHGLLLAGALVLARQQRWTGLGIAALVIAKLLWEQVNGPLPSSEAMIQNSVVVDAHLYGAIGGVATIYVIELIQRWRRNLAG